VNQFLIERGVLDTHKGEVVDSGCSYFSSISFPDLIHTGISRGKAGQLQRALRDRPLPQRRYVALRRRPLCARLCGALHSRSMPIPADVRSVLETLETPPGD
jgi:acyl-CoA thioester hydrolase